MKNFLKIKADKLKRDELIEKIKTSLGVEKLRYLLKNIKSFETQSLRDLEMMVEDLEGEK